LLAKGMLRDHCAHNDMRDSIIARAGDLPARSNLPGRRRDCLPKACFAIAALTMTILFRVPSRYNDRNSFLRASYGCRKHPSRQPGSTLAGHPLFHPAGGPCFGAAPTLAGLPGGGLAGASHAHLCPARLREILPGRPMDPPPVRNPLCLAVVGALRPGLEPLFSLPGDGLAALLSASRRNGLGPAERPASLAEGNAAQPADQ
jgi:hypothetical protein